MFYLYAFFFSLTTTIYCNNNDLNIPFNRQSPPAPPSPSITNLSTVIGETISFNCSIISVGNDFKLNPTWLKADIVYNQFGHIISYKTENIIITRKGIIIDSLRDKIKLTTTTTNGLGREQFQTLKLNNVNIKSEGKYICREFNSQLDKLFYLNVYAGVAGLNMKFSSNSKYFRIIQPGSSGSPDDENNFLKYANSLTSSISVKENDELLVNCSVNSSKPAANLSIWILPNHRTSNDDDTRKVELNELFTVKNKDFTLKTIGIARIIVNRFDNLKSVTCIAENNALDEKWETKKILNVLYSPRCSKYQKLIYNTGINQTIELECRMTDANPPYLNFNWKLANEYRNNNHNNNNNKEKFRTSGFTSRIKFTPESHSDFGQISCYASNGLEDGECKMQLQLGGTPNPPFDCFHKENNKTIIIECKPGFDQGDPEVYFYLLKKKPAGVLVEYARKRDSCSFLISNLILEEHLNDFFIYSSNKYGNNKDHATKLTIENKEFLLKNLEQLKDTSNENHRRITLIVVCVCVLLVAFIFFICILVKCYNQAVSDKKLSYSSTDSASSYKESPRNNYKHHHHETYKYSSHLNNYNSQQKPKTEFFPSSTDSLKQKQQQNSTKNNEEKIDYSITSNESMTTDFETEKATPSPIYDNNNLLIKKKLNADLTLHNLRSPSLLKNIQDLDMSPKSKRIFTDKRNKDPSLRSFTDETAETDSETYADLTNQKHNNFEITSKKPSFYNKCETDENLNNNKNQLMMVKPVANLNIWYNESNDDYSGMSVDKSIQNETPMKISDFSSFNRILNEKLPMKFTEFDEDQEEKKLFQWPNSSLPLFSNETCSSLDIDDEKIVGILV